MVWVSGWDRDSGGADVWGSISGLSVVCDVLGGGRINVDGYVNVSLLCERVTPTREAAAAVPLSMHPSSPS